MRYEYKSFNSSSCLFSFLLSLFIGKSMSKKNVDRKDRKVFLVMRRFLQRFFLIIPDFDIRRNAPEVNKLTLQADSNPAWSRWKSAKAREDKLSAEAVMQSKKNCEEKYKDLYTNYPQAFYVQCLHHGINEQWTSFVSFRFSCTCTGSIGEIKNNYRKYNAKAIFWAQQECSNLTFMAFIFILCSTVFKTKSMYKFT